MKREMDNENAGYSSTLRWRRIIVTAVVPLLAFAILSVHYGLLLTTITFCIAIVGMTIPLMVLFSSFRVRTIMRKVFYIDKTTNARGDEKN